MTTPTELLRQAREALAYLLPLAEMQPADVEPGRHLMRGDCPDETQPSSRDAECPACKKMVAADELIAAIDALPSAPAWPCHCDERGIGKPGVTCGDCPRDYGHTVDSAPSGEPAPTRADLIAALTFYATCGHMNLSDESAWDTVSGEPQNWWCDEAGTATIEDGSLARMALAGDMNADHFAALERGDDVCIDPGTGREAPQAAPVPAPSDDISAATLLEAMARNYAGGHSWDRLDGEACMRAAAVIRRLADPASPAAAAPEPVAWLVSGGRLFVDKAFTRKTEAEIAIDKRCDDSVLVPLYTHPAPAVAATVQPLTNAEILKIRIAALQLTMGAHQDVPDGELYALTFASLLWRRFRAHGIATPAPKEQQ